MIKIKMQCKIFAKGVKILELSLTFSTLFLRGFIMHCRYEELLIFKFSIFNFQHYLIFFTVFILH